MGRLKTTQTDYAYIAGFLDGDGSIMAQIKKRSDTKQGWRFMFTICFYQDTGNAKPLEWIKKKLGIGCISHRKDKMTELRINGYETIEKILEKLKPYVKFKKEQVRCALKILSIIKGKTLNKLTQKEREKIAEYIIALRKKNYWSHWRKYSEEEIKKIIIGSSLSP